MVSTNIDLTPVIFRSDQGAKLLLPTKNMAGNPVFAHTGIYEVFQCAVASLAAANHYRYSTGTCASLRRTHSCRECSRWELSPRVKVPVYQ